MIPGSWVMARGLWSMAPGSSSKVAPPSTPWALEPGAAPCLVASGSCLVQARWPVHVRTNARRRDTVFAVSEVGGRDSLQLEPHSCTPGRQRRRKSALLPGACGLRVSTASTWSVARKSTGVPPLRPSYPPSYTTRRSLVFLLCCPTEGRRQTDGRVRIHVLWVWSGSLSTRAAVGRASTPPLSTSPLTHSHTSGHD